MRISDWSSDVCSSDLWPEYASGRPQINNKTRYSRNHGVRGAIFLPQQRERNALALDLPRNQRPVRLGQILRRTPDSPKTQPFTRRVVVIAQRQWQAPSPPYRARRTNEQTNLCPR